MIDDYKDAYLETDSSENKGITDVTLVYSGGELTYFVDGERDENPFTAAPGSHLSFSINGAPWAFAAVGQNGDEEGTEGKSAVLIQPGKSARIKVRSKESGDVEYPVTLMCFVLTKGVYSPVFPTVYPPDSIRCDTRMLILGGGPRMKVVA